MRTIGTVLATLATLALLAGCSGSRRRPTEPALEQVHSRELRSQMASLEALAVYDLSDATRSATARHELVRVADELAATAARIPDGVGTLELGEEDRSHFVTFADSLRASALRLGEAAPVAPGPEVKARIDDVTATCAACHWAFRVGPTGE